MLAMANKNGFVFASIPGLANRARVPVESVREAIQKFQQPDPDSRTKDFDGRRIEEVDGGWKLLNYAKHRAIRDEEERREYMANLMRNKRAVSKVSRGNPPLSQAEAEAEAEKTKPKPSTRKARGQLEPTDPRWHHCVDILHRYWDRWAKEKIRFELWFDAPGGKQLKNILGRHKAITVEEFTRCVANRAKSTGVKHEEPFYLWGGHILEWVGGPKINGASKDNDRNARNRAAILKGSGLDGFLDGPNVPSGSDDRTNSILAGGVGGDEAGKDTAVLGGLLKK